MMPRAPAPTVLPEHLWPTFWDRQREVWERFFEPINAARAVDNHPEFLRLQREQEQALEAARRHVLATGVDTTRSSALMTQAPLPWV